MPFDIKKNWPIVAGFGAGIAGILYLSRQKGSSNPTSQFIGTPPQPTGQVQANQQAADAMSKAYIAQMNNQTALAIESGKVQLGISQQNSMLQTETIKAQSGVEIARIMANTKTTGDYLNAISGIVSKVFPVIFPPGQKTVSPSDSSLYPAGFRGPDEITMRSIGPLETYPSIQDPYSSRASFDRFGGDFLNAAWSGPGDFGGSSLTTPPFSVSSEVSGSYYPDTGFNYDPTFATYGEA